MSSELMKNWPSIVRFFEKSLKRNHFVTFTSIGPDGGPHAAPYGSLFLNADGTGYYMDCFPNQFSKNIKKDGRICILVVQRGFWCMIKAFWIGRFDEWPGIRLYGTVDKARKPRPREIDRWQKKVRRYKWFKGYDLLWKNINVVRDIHFSHYEPVHLGAMTTHLMTGSKEST